MALLNQGLIDASPYKRTYANAADRVADTAFTSIDQYTWAYQIDDGTHWVLTSVSPITWVQHSTNGTDGTDGTDGADGLSVTDATIDINGHLLLQLSDSSVLDAGVIPIDITGDPADLISFDSTTNTLTINTTTLTEFVQDAVAAQLSTSGALDLTYDDAAGTLTLTFNGEASSIVDFTEAVQDVIGALFATNSDLTWTYNDAGDAESVVLTATAVTPETYGNKATVPSFTVDDKGRLTNAAETAIECGCSIVFDGGGSVLTIGTKGSIEVPYNMYIDSVSLIGDAVGSIVLDIWKDTFANFPPTVADTIVASAKPTLSSAQTYQDTTLTGWTRTLNQGDWLRFNIDSVTTIQRATLAIKGHKV